MKYFAKIKYLGTDFSGFQVQPNRRTVQGELCRALTEAFGFPAKVTGCSRTDAGVHANEFCILVECDGATIPPEKLPVAVARFMPSDLALFYAEEASSDFHPRYDAKSKEYVYRIENSRVFDPFDYGRVWFLPGKITDEGYIAMQMAAKAFIGYHDFSAFMSEGSDVSDTHRTVNYLEIDKNGDSYTVRINADGFLYNMVRIIVGTLVEVAFGRIKADDIPEIIESHSRKRAGMTAPAEGLYLNRVFY